MSYYESGAKKIWDDATGEWVSVPDIPEIPDSYPNLNGIKNNIDFTKYCFETPDTVTATSISQAIYDSRQNGGNW